MVSGRESFAAFVSLPLKVSTSQFNSAVDYIVLFISCWAHHLAFSGKLYHIHLFAYLFVCLIGGTVNHFLRGGSVILLLHFQSNRGVVKKVRQSVGKLDLLTRSAL